MTWVLSCKAEIQSICIEFDVVSGSFYEANSAQELRKCSPNCLFSQGTDSTSGTPKEGSNRPPLGLPEPRRLDATEECCCDKA
jgi:hypothetical protein